LTSIRQFLAMLLILAALAPCEAVAELRSGFWLARLSGQGGDLPFRMCMGKTEEHWAARIQNGDKVLTFPVVQVGTDSIVIDLLPYPAQIRAHMNGDASTLDGTWTRHFWVHEWVELPFHAEWRVTTRECFSDTSTDRGTTWVDIARFERAVQTRFLVAPHGAPRLDNPFTGRWSVSFDGEEHPSVALFEYSSMGRLTGTILTATGDYRYLEGALKRDSLHLATFDGSHAYLFEAKRQPDGSLAGDFWSYGKWDTKWTARRDSSARLPDPLGLAHWNKKTWLRDLVFPDVDGKKHSLADPEFAGKAKLLMLSASWCPNCSDATQHILELDRTYRARGLQVIGICFEMNDDFAANARQVRRYVQKHAIPYPVLIAPLHDHMSESFPAVQPLYAIPTFVFLDRKGRARCVYSGYSGPASLADHVRLREMFDSLVNEILAGD
jgi:thiol-disulfide isomerase/thioredoxin